MRTWLLVVAVALCACPAKEKVVDSGVEVEKPKRAPNPRAPTDALPPSKDAAIPPGGTCIAADDAMAVAIFSSGREHGCPKKLDRTMSGDKDWPKVFTTLGIVALNVDGTEVEQQKRGDDKACCYDVRSPRPEDAPPQEQK